MKKAHMIQTHNQIYLGVLSTWKLNEQPQGHEVETRATLFHRKNRKTQE